jgi:hypothetical protein
MAKKNIKNPIKKAAKKVAIKKTEETSDILILDANHSSQKELSKKITENNNKIFRGNL